MGDFFGGIAGLYAFVYKGFAKICSEFVRHFEGLYTLTRCAWVFKAPFLGIRVQSFAKGSGDSKTVLTVRVEGLRGSEAQRAQYPLIKEYGLNHNMKPYII